LSARATRERILRACADLVARSTSLNVSIPELAHAAGVSQPTVYRYFPTKRDLFNAVATLQFERVTARPEAAALEPLLEQLGLHQAAAVLPDWLDRAASESELS